MYSVVTRKFSDVWKPSKNICIDEGMIPFREKVHFKVYNSDKPVKYCYSRIVCELSFSHDIVVVWAER